MTKQQLIFIQDMLFDRVGIEKDHKKADLCFECLDIINETLKELDHGSDRNAEANK